MYPLKFSPVKVCNNGEIRFFPTGVHQDDDPTPTVVEEPDWKLELVENDPEPEWESRKAESIRLPNLSPSLMKE